MIFLKDMAGAGFAVILIAGIIRGAWWLIWPFKPAPQAYRDQRRRQEQFEAKYAALRRRGQ